MKNIIAYTLLIVMAIGLTGCSKDLSVNYKARPTEYQVSIGGRVLTPGETTSMTLNFESAATSFILDIQGGGNGWWIQLPETCRWLGFNNSLTKSELYGTGNKQVEMFVGENTTGAERSFEVTLFMSFKLPPVKFIIVQK